MTTERRDGESVQVRGTWPLAKLDTAGRPMWYVTGTQPPEYAHDAALEARWRAGQEQPKKALDLFCCAGGATKGLQRAGYHVTGVDIHSQPRYCGDVFYQDDAMAWLRGERAALSQFDLIWASPPCQRYSNLTPTAHKDAHPDLLPEALGLLRDQGRPYICENVEGTQHMMRSPMFLCGTMFGLAIQRHRWFEIGNADAFFLLPPCNHSIPPVLISGTTRRLINGKRYEFTKTEKTAAIGIDWMTTAELDEAIPPAYSEFLARQIQAARQETFLEAA